MLQNIFWKQTVSHNMLPKFQHSEIPKFSDTTSINVSSIPVVNFIFIFVSQNYPPPLFGDG